jgi:hypothetical protein
VAGYGFFGRISALPLSTCELTTNDRAQLTSIARQVEGALLGQVAAIDALRRASPEQVFDAVRGRQLILSRDAVASVLNQFRNGEIAATAAQQWASFVSHGYVVGVHHVGPIKPVEIEWELPYEDAMAESIARLNELGDLIDGEFAEGEADRLIADLA